MMLPEQFGSVYDTYTSEHFDASAAVAEYADLKARTEARYREAVERSGRGEGDSYAVPHHLTFASVWNWALKYYRTYYDESQIDSLQNSMAMRRDGFIQALLWQRQLPTVNLEYELECDDPEDPGQVKVRKELQRVIDRIPYFKRLVMQLLESIFYGKSGVQLSWDRKRVSGKDYSTVVAHKPVNGDKIAYDYDGNPGIFIYRAASVFKDARAQPYIKNLDRGPALFLIDEFYRDSFVIHEFQPTDTDYLFESEKSGSVHGSGVRDRFYLTWMIRQQVLTWYLNAVERVGANGMLFAYYPIGNAKARDAVMRALKDLLVNNVAAFPRTMGDTSSMIDRIDPSQVGYEVMYQILNHIEEIMKVGILGAGMASGAGANQEAGESKEDVIVYDSACVAETIDQQLIQKIVKYNTWEYEGKKYRGNDLPFTMRYKLQADRQNVRDLIASAEALWRMGVPLDGDDLRSRAGLTAPRSKATLIVAPGGITGGSDNSGAVQGDVGASGVTPAGGGGGGGGGQAPPNAGGMGAPTPAKFALKGLGKPFEQFITSDEVDQIAAAVDPEPSDAQKEAGNYRKAHVTVHGLPVTIETPKGGVRSGTSKDGKSWSVVMGSHYGYIKRTHSEADGDHVDVFLGPDPDCDSVYVVNQVKPDGSFDEHKCMIGYKSLAAARAAYLDCYSAGWKGLGSIVPVTMPWFKAWLEDGNTRRAVGEYENFAADPCGDGGDVHGFHEGNTCGAGGGGHPDDEVSVEVAPGHVVQVSRKQAALMVGNPHLPHARIVEPATRPGAGGVESDARAVLAAFKKIDASKNNNFVNLYDMRKFTPEIGRAEFDAAVNKLRRDGVLTLDSHEGLHGVLTREQKEAGIRESGQNLLWASLRDAEQFAAVAYDESKHRRAREGGETGRDGTFYPGGRFIPMNNDPHAPAAGRHPAERPKGGGSPGLESNAPRPTPAVAQKSKVANKFSYKKQEAKLIGEFIRAGLAEAVNRRPPSGSSPAEDDEETPVGPPTKEEAAYADKVVAESFPVPSIDGVKAVEMILKRIEEIEFLPTKLAVDIIGSEKPAYLDDVEHFVSGQRKKFDDGGVKPRDVAKAVLITVASQGSDSRALDVLRENLGPDDPYIQWMDNTDEGRWFAEMATDTDSSGRPNIRPEDAAAGWFLTPEGRHALDNLDNGEFNVSDWDGLVKVRKAYGDDRFTTVNILGSKATKEQTKLELKDVHQVANLINEAKGDPAKIDQALGMLKGVGVGKTGFVKHFFGLTDRTTVDAVQTNFWITGKGDVRRDRDELSSLLRVIKSYESNPRVSQAVADRVQKKMKHLQAYMKKNYGQEVSQHILHHWLWDAAKGSTAKHLGMYAGYTLG